MRAVDLNDGYVHETSRTLTEKGFRSAGKSALLFEPDTLAISKSGTIGRIGILKDYMCGNRAVINIKVNRDVCDSRFIFYVLLTSRKTIENLSIGSVQKNLYTSELGKLEFQLPPLRIQNRITKILGSIDDKIELNRQINQTLEQIAQAIFKSWFVDFDPVKAKIWANENGHDPERAAMCALAGLPYADDALDHLSPEQQQQLATTAALFPDSLKESELGEIPSGWEVSPIEKHVMVKHGFAFKGEHFSDSETDNVLLTPGNFRIGGGFKFDKLKHYDGPIPSDYILAKHDLLITMTDLSKQADTLGYPALVPSVPGKNFLHNQRLGKVLPKHGSLLNYYFYCLFCTDRYRNEIVGGATGSTVKHTAPIKIGSVKHVFNGSLEKTFNNLVSPMFSEIENRFNEILALTQLRDTLLPKLLSGELSVADLPEVADAGASA